MQHGTVAERNRVPSVSPLIHGPEGFLLAGAGYATCMPDYIGLGESGGLHPFLHAESSAAVDDDFDEE